MSNSSAHRSGPRAAKPAVIRERMGISLLTTAQVKSHLQKYRIRVVAEKGSEHATEAQVGARGSRPAGAAGRGYQWEAAACSPLGAPDWCASP